MNTRSKFNFPVWLTNFADSLRLVLLVSVIYGIKSFSSSSETSFWLSVKVAVFDSIIAGSIPFAIQLYFRLGKAVPTSNRLDNVLDGFDDKLDKLDKNILEIETKFDDKLDKLDKNILEIETKFDDNINDLEKRLLPVLYITDGMKSFHQGWQKWLNNLEFCEDFGELEKEALKLLVEAYLKEEAERVESKYIFTNTNCYTTLINEVSRYLHEYNSKNIHRFHITGMLPEEFYNGPQIEFIAGDSKPLFYCHKWEDYENFYSSPYKGLQGEVDIKRYIIVRQANLFREPLSALSTLNDLQEQSKLSIINGERIFDDLSQEKDSVKKRLFRKCGFSQQQNFNNLINSILGRQNYKYWPIAPTQDCCNDIRFESLLKVFAQDFHGLKENNALYWSLDGDAWAEIERYQLLKDCFKPGWTPEITLFGKLRNDGKIDVWYFGILGHWRPFTPDIELRFLTSEHTSKLYEELTLCLKKNNGKLMSL